MREELSRVVINYLINTAGTAMFKYTSERSYIYLLHFTALLVNK